MIEKITLIQKVIFSLDLYLTDQVKWKLLKNEIRKFAQNSCKLQTSLETKIKNLEQNITDEDKFNEYKAAKDEFENLYDNIATGVKIRSKFEVNAIGINTVKNLLKIFSKFGKAKSCKWYY